MKSMTNSLKSFTRRSTLFKFTFFFILFQLTFNLSMAQFVYDTAYTLTSNGSDVLRFLSSANNGDYVIGGRWGANSGTDSIDLDFGPGKAMLYSRGQRW